MDYLFWIGGAGLLAIAGFAVWRAFQNPAFYAAAIKMIVAALLPVILKRKSPEEEKLDNEAYRRNQVRPTKQRRHPGEGGHR